MYNFNQWLSGSHKRIVFIGDSITHIGTYIAYLDAYLWQHFPKADLELIDLGVSSETASGLSEPDHPYPRPCVHNRIGRLLAQSRPDLAVICYGVNDAIYHPFSDGRFEAYKIGMLRLIQKVKATGSKVAVMTPTCFDAESFTCKLLPGGCEKYSFCEAYENYDAVMERYAEWVMSLRGSVDAAVDIHTAMKTYFEAKRRENTAFVSGDGIHPKEGGHWVIASALLKAIFNITLERVPDFVSDADSEPFFAPVMEHHLTMSAAWREHVGHDNPQKDEALPLDKAKERGKRLKEQADQLLKDIDPHKIKTSAWRKYNRADFYVNGREGILISTGAHKPGNPWIWRTEFFDGFSTADLELMDEGFALAYYRIPDMYASPLAVSLMGEFQEYIVRKFSLCPRTVPFGFSRGGMYAVNYAAAFPQNVAVLYIDAPALDIQSWPGGRGKGCGSPLEYEDCLFQYGLNAENAPLFKDNAVDRAEKIAAAKIPVILVAGDSDTVVPYDENGRVFARRFIAAGGNISVIIKPGCGHHPHSLENPKPIVDFVKTYYR